MSGPSREMPMFPLGTVLFPTTVLPLHVFEPRYREMTRVCLAGDNEFGVVLIERGSEVGGGDVRTDVGTVAQILQAQELPDGRWGLVTVGTRRIRVVEWLPDDPYPRALVTEWTDEPATDDLSTQYASVVAQLRRVLALRSELGDPGPGATVDVAGDPALGSYQVAGLAPAGPLDRQRLLVATDVRARLALLAELLDDEESVLRQRLAMG